MKVIFVKDEYCMCNSESNKSCGLERMNASDVPLSAVWRIQLYKDEEGPVVVTDSDDDDAVTDSACSSKSFGSSKSLSATTNKTFDTSSSSKSFSSISSTDSCSFDTNTTWIPMQSESAKSFFASSRAARLKIYPIVVDSLLTKDPERLRHKRSVILPTKILDYKRIEESSILPPIEENSETIRDKSQRHNVMLKSLHVKSVASIIHTGSQIDPQVAATGSKSSPLLLPPLPLHSSRI